MTKELFRRLFARQSDTSNEISVVNSGYKNRSTKKDAILLFDRPVTSSSQTVSNNGRKPPLTYLTASARATLLARARAPQLNPPSSADFFLLPCAASATGWVTGW